MKMLAASMLIVAHAAAYTAVQDSPPECCGTAGLFAPAYMTTADGTLVLAGGSKVLYEHPQAPVETIYAYSPKSNTWSNLASLSAANYRGAAAQLPNDPKHIYMLGGCEFVPPRNIVTGHITRIDLDTQSTEQVGDFSQLWGNTGPRCGHVLVPTPKLPGGFLIFGGDGTAPGGGTPVTRSYTAWVNVTAFEHDVTPGFQILNSSGAMPAYQEPGHDTFPGTVTNLGGVLVNDRYVYLFGGSMHTGWGMDTGGTSDHCLVMDLDLLTLEGKETPGPDFHGGCPGEPPEGFMGGGACFKRCAPLPNPRTNMMVALLPELGKAGKIVLTGGIVYDKSIKKTVMSATTDVYDIASDSWSSGPSLSGARALGAAAAIGKNEVLVAAGYNLTDSSTGTARTAVKASEVLTIDG
jgi:hypothetical protein